MEQTIFSTKIPTNDRGTLTQRDWCECRRDFGSLIDLRSQTEFSRGAIPGARNLPVLNDDERSRVGKTYKESGSQDAVRSGLEIFARKADAFHRKLPRGPVTVYCWRGGMRSRILALWLAAQGRQVRVLNGGYKRFRQQTLTRLDRLANHPLLVLDGRTGVGKTELISEFFRKRQSIDFEGLACHRGSAFGDFPLCLPCPTQQDFENRLAEIYAERAGQPRLLVEIENFIGPVRLPLLLRKKIGESPSVLVRRDFDDRVERLSREYATSWSDEMDQRFVERADLLRKHLGVATLKYVIDRVQKRDFSTAIATLLGERYDRVYDKGIRKRRANVIAEFNLSFQKAEALEFIEHYLAKPL